MTVQEYLSIETKDGIATIWINQKDSKVNKVSPEAIGLFDEVMDTILKDRSIKGVVIASKKKDFIAGADIESFKEVKNPGDFLPISKKGHEILNRIQNAPFPIVAAINGSCLGAGLEIALACTARIAAKEPTTKMALPEMKLGLLPGGGGTQRLPRLVGIQKALDMMLTGKNIYASQAKRMGLVDDLVPSRKLHQAACIMANNLAKKPMQRKDKRSFFDKVLEGPGKGIIFKKAKEMVMKMTYGNYPAPLEIIECVRIGMEKGMEVGLQEEAKRFEKLILSPESRQLINIFFAMTEKKKNPMAELVKPINNLGMLGAGFMGAGIAEVSIMDNIFVSLKDIKEETLAEAKKTIWKSLKKKVKYKSITRPEADETIARVSSHLEYDTFKHADIIVEAVFEDLNLKQKIIKEVEEVISDDCIFASNTSALPIGDIAKASKRPEQVIGLHYFSPVPKMPLLEIVVTPQTSDWVTATSLELGIRQGKTCIVVKDGPGFYTTRILGPFMNEALLMMEEGADAKELDKAMKEFGYPVGPVTLLDEVGIDVGAHIMQGELMDFFKKTRVGVKASTGIIAMDKAGYKGRKNKKGFFLYDQKTGKKVKGQIDTSVYQFFGGSYRKTFSKEDIQKRLSLAMINEAAMCLQEGIISTPLDGDIGAIFGLGFPPFRGGPFRYMDTVGAQYLVDVATEMREKYGERFQPAQIIVDKANSGEKFYAE